MEREDGWAPEWARAITFEAKRGRYDKVEVDRVFGQFIDSYERLWNERDELRATVAALEGENAETRDLERGLRDAIVRGQRIADEIRDEAAAERDRLLEVARADIERVLADAQEEVQHLQHEIARLRTLRLETRRDYKGLLVAGLELLDDFPVEETEADDAAMDSDVRDELRARAATFDRKRSET